MVTWPLCSEDVCVIGTPHKISATVLHASEISKPIPYSGQLGISLENQMSTRSVRPYRPGTETWADMCEHTRVGNTSSAMWPRASKGGRSYYEPQRKVKVREQAVICYATSDCIGVWAPSCANENTLMTRVCWRAYL